MSGFARGRSLWLVLLAGCLLQQPGRTTWDTKLDLTTDPSGFLERALHLWNPDASFGELQNQAYGYLFPHGPFFVLGDVVGVPDWVLQRLWSALLLIAAYEGTRYLARALGLGTAAGVLGGLVYALSPRLLGAAGVLTGEVMATAMLPWALLPLVLVRGGRLGPRQAGLWCGVAVLCMSGVNAAEVVAVVPILAFAVLAQLREDHGRRLAAWWLVGMSAGCAWWLIPLVLLGRYSPPFLDFIETADATTYPTGWSNSVRGSEHWLAYFAIGDQAWWPAAHQLATLPVLVLTTGIVAAWGLWGLSQRAMPMRGPLLASAVLGLVCLTAGNPSALGSLVDGPVRDLLDGALAPLRNVHKVDPLVRLPLALGAGHAFAWIRGRPPTARPSTDPGFDRLLQTRQVGAWRRWAALTVVAVVVAGGLPLASNAMRMPGYREIPAAWHEAAAYLDKQPGSRALVLPGTGFGLQEWGWTIDEPMQGVARSPWVTRSQVPLVPGPTARYLDTIERRIASGEGGVGLADLLARGGITHVVLRRDVNPFVAETVPVPRAEVALASSPGLTAVASFGRTGFGEQALIDVFAVDDSVSRVSLADADAVATIEGAPDDLLTALETGTVGRHTPVVIAPRPVGGGLVSDGYRLVERQFGRTHEAVSQTKSRSEPWTTARPSHDYPGAPGVARASSEVLDYGGSGVRVVASSSQGYAEELGAVRPEYGPQSAIDGNGETQWRSGSFEPPTEQWLDLRPEEPLTGGVLGVQFEFGTAARVTRVRVQARTERGEVSVVYGVHRRGLLLAPLPAEDVTGVRVAVVAVAGDPTLGQVRISEVTLPERPTSRSLVLPEPIGRADTLVLRVDPPRRPCVDVGLGPQCQEDQARPGEDAGWLDRSFTADSAGAWNLTGSVVATPGVASSALLAATDSSLRVRALSVFGGDPAVAGAFALDDNPATLWLSESHVERATIRLSWQGKRLVQGLSIFRAPGNVVAPATARLRSGNITRLVDLDWSSEVKPFVADGRLSITFTRPTTVGSRGRPMGVGEIQVDGLEPLKAPVDLAAPTGAACGLGPQVRVDGVVHDTEVTGTIDDVRLGRPLTWRVCDGSVGLAVGEHRVQVAPTAQFQPVQLAWRPVAGDPPVDGRSDRTLDVRRWDDTSRAVDIGPGSAAILRVAENVNEGWQATLGGRRLDAVTLDGWQQGYLVPAGDGGRLALTYAPDTPYRWGLFAGLLLAGLLVVGATLGQFRARRREPSDPVVSRPVLWPGSEESSGGILSSRTGRAGVGASLFVLGGPVVAGAYLLTARRRARRHALALGGVALAGAAVVAALTESTRAGRPGVVADGLVAAGIGLLVGGAVFGRHDPESTTLGVAPAWRQVRRRVAEHRVMLLGLLLVLCQALVRAWVASGSYFWQDDFLHLDLSRTSGLSQEYLVRDYSGHLEPAQYLVIWAIGQAGEGSFAPAVWVLVGLQALASTLLLVLLLLLFGRRSWLLVPFAAYLFTPLGLVTATWLAAGLQAYPLQIAMLTSVIGLVRLRQTGRRRWWLVSLAGHVLGLHFWEKAALVLPALLAVDLLVLSARSSPRHLLRRIRRHWLFWLSHAAVLAAYVWCYLRVVELQDVGGTRERGVATTVYDVVLQTLVPGLFGGPWHADGAANTVYADPDARQEALFVGLALLLVAGSLWRVGKAAWAGWLLIGVYVTMDLTLLLLGRGEYLLLVARDPRYITDALPVAAIGVCAAYSRTPIRAAGHHADTRRRGAALVVALAVCLVAASGLVTTAQLAPRVQHSQAEEYVRGVTGELEGSPGASVLLTAVPPEVSVSVSLPSLLNAVWREQAFARPGGRPRLVSAEGSLVPAEITEPDLVASGPLPDCGWRLGEAPQQLERFADPGEGERLVRLRYLTRTPGILHLSVAEAEEAVRYHGGLGEVYFVVTGMAGPVRAWVTRTVGGGDIRLCVTDLVRGTPGPSD